MDKNAMRPQLAWCWASGLIEIGDVMPASSADGSGAILIACGPKKHLEQRLSAVARHGKGASAGKLLVPGVPEAETPDQALDALITWCDWSARGTHHDGVVFVREVM